MVLLKGKYKTIPKKIGEEKFILRSIDLMRTIAERWKMVSILVMIFLVGFVPILPDTANAESTDMVWENIDFAKSVNYRDIVKSDKELYVVVGDEGTIKTSKDLNIWETQNSETKNYLFGCAWGDGKFVAVGSNGTILYSDDGVRWHASEVDSKIDLYGIVWGNGKFVAVGRTQPGGKQIILSSTDGKQWAGDFRITGDFEITGDSCWDKIVFTNNVYFALGFSHYAISQDGLKWTVKAMPKDLSPNDILWDGKQYVAVGDDSIVYVSKDAMEWNSVATNISDGLFLLSITKLKNKYIVIVESGSSCSIISSSNLTIWSDVNKRNYSEISKIIITDDKLVAAGWHETILQTKDGNEWSVSEKYAPNLMKVIWNGKQFLSIGNDGTVYFSKDGRTWNSSVIESNDPIVDVVWTGREYAALSVAFDTKPDSYNILKSDVYTSLDGINWICTGCIKQKNIDKLFYFDNRYFALGRDGEILVSEDTKNWIAANTSTDNWLSGLAWNGKQFVSVGMFGTIISSSDGINWSKQVSKCNSDLYSVIWNGNTFAVAGDWKTVSISKDGISWSTTTSTSLCSLENVIWDGEKFLFIENVGEIYSTKGLKRPTLIATSSLGSPSSIAWNGECYIMVGRNGTIALCVPQNPIKVKINNSPTLLNDAPFIINGKLMIPAKELAEKLDANYSWNQADKTMKITKGGAAIILKIESKTASVNGKTIKLETPSIIVNGVVMISAKFLIDNLSARFTWNGDTNTISIIK